jgi:hypothetical protein
MSDKTRVILFWLNVGCAGLDALIFGSSILAGKPDWMMAAWGVVFLFAAYTVAPREEKNGKIK